MGFSTGVHEVSKESVLIRKIQAESKRLINNSADMSELLNSSDDYIKFWSAMGCIENAHCSDIAIEKLEDLLSNNAAYSITFRAGLIISMYKNGALFDYI